jgi:hypothetical protein
VQKLNINKMIQMPQHTVFLPPMDIKAVCSTACVVTKQLPCFYLCECVCKCYLRGRCKDAQKQAVVRDAGNHWQSAGQEMVAMVHNGMQGDGC